MFWSQYPGPGIHLPKTHLNPVKQVTAAHPPPGGFTGGITGGSLIGLHAPFLHCYPDGQPSC